MSIKLTNAQEKVIQELSEKISQIRVEEYEKAVGVLELSKKQSNTLSDKISRAEVNNLIIARPSLPKRPDFKTPEDIDHYIGKLRANIEYGVEKAQQSAMYKYIGKINKVWGSEAAKEVLNIAKTNPAKFIKNINAGNFPPLQYVYQIKDPEVQESYIDKMYEVMSK